MRVLIACERSGRVRDAYASQGHEAWSCDLFPSDTPGNHYQGDVRDILRDNWNRLIAFPDCTYLTVSANGPMTHGCSLYTAEEARQRRREAIDFFLLLMNANIGEIALENPIGIMSTLYRKPDQIIQPYNFCADASKRTCFWLKGLPKLRQTHRVQGRWVFDRKRGIFVERWENQTDSGQNRLPPSEDRKELRAKTYWGVAEAMARQWS